MGDLLTGLATADTVAVKALLRRTLKPQARTEPGQLRGVSRLSNPFTRCRVANISVALRSVPAGRLIYRRAGDAASQRAGGSLGEAG
jgi:hypothetical protein